MADPPDAMSPFPPKDSETHIIAWALTNECMYMAKIAIASEAERIAEERFDAKYNAGQVTEEDEDHLNGIQDHKTDLVRQLVDTRVTLCDNLGIKSGDLDDAVFRDHRQMLLMAFPGIGDYRTTGGLPNEGQGQAAKKWARTQATLKALVIERPAPQPEQQIDATWSTDSDYDGDREDSHDGNGTQSTTGTPSLTRNKHERAGSSENSSRGPTASPPSAAAMLPTTERRRARWAADLQRIRDDASADGAVPASRWAPQPPDSSLSQGTKRKYEDDEGQSG